MFDEAFRTLFLSKPAKLSHKNNNLIISLHESEASIPLRDISTIIIDTPQISLSASLLSTLATHQILLFTCDDSHIPNGIFLPFLSHYHHAHRLKQQIELTKRQKSILWQQNHQGKNCQSS